MMHSSWKTALGICLLPVFLLSGCGGDPVRPTEPAAETPKGTSRTPTRKPSVTLKRGGGFYKDDGPGDDIPDGLDDIPDAVPRFEPLHRFANRPYVVLGKEYLPNTSIKPYKRQGIGSWYGKKFHGQKTSIGETYDMFGMTAAHPTLAIPSYVRVTNVANGRSVIVRVNDRGPFHADRIIDLSYAAAYKLDYIGSGSALVEVETIVPDATGMTYADLRPAPTAQTAQGEQDEIAQMAKKWPLRSAPRNQPLAPGSPARKASWPRAAYSCNWGHLPMPTTLNPCSRNLAGNWIGSKANCASMSAAASIAYTSAPSSAVAKLKKWQSESARITASSRPSLRDNRRQGAENPLHNGFAIAQINDLRRYLDGNMLPIGSDNFTG